MHCYGRAAKRRRDRKYKRKLKRLYSFGTITPAIWYVDADYPYKTVNKPYFVKSYKSIGRNKGLYYVAYFLFGESSACDLIEHWEEECAAHLAYSNDKKDMYEGRW